jgi:hypothetical protein
MKKPLKACVSFFRLNGRMKKQVVLIIITYLRVSCLVRCCPLKKYYHRFFMHDNIKPFDFAPYRDDLNLINKVIKRMPGKHTCLKESIIVHLYFRRKKLNIPLYLGVSTKNEFQAHAWYDQNRSGGYNQLNVNDEK